MIRPPPSSTRTDTLFPYTNALPISFVHSGRHPGQASARLLYLGEREPGSRANVRALALDPRLKAEGDDESWWRHWCDHRQRCVNSVARQEGAETRAPAAAMDTLSERSIPIPFQRRCALSTSIDLSFVKQFDREVHEHYQRKGSLLPATVRSTTNVKAASRSEEHTYELPPI